jgi:hypothetical protein
MVGGLHIFIQNRKMKPLAIASSGAWGSWWGEMVEAIYTMYNVSLFGMVTESPLYNKYILIKKREIQKVQNSQRNLNKKSNAWNISIIRVQIILQSHSN